MVKITIEITTNEKNALEVMRLLQGAPAETRVEAEKTPPVAEPADENPAEKQENKKPHHEKGYRLPEGKWSEKYDKCQGCETTGRKHMGKGLCTRCYMAKRNGREISQKTVEEKKQELQFMGVRVCQNPKCPYQPTDYRKEDMVQSKKTGKWYCDDGCREEAEG